MALTYLLENVAKGLGAIPIIVFYFGILLLAFGAPFAAQRYRLNHTIWRGIRGGMTGSMLKYGWWALLYTLAAVVSFYQLVPWASVRIYERLANASFFGSQRVTSRSRAMLLYATWLLTFLCLLGLIIFAGVIFFLSNKIALHEYTQGVRLNDKLQTQQALIAMLPMIVFLYFFLIIGSTLIYCFYYAKFSRHVIGNTTLGDIQLASDVTGLQLLGLLAGNLAIFVCTLGLGIPVIIHRNQRFLTTHLLATGELDLDQLKQIDQPVSRFGEGMFQALDSGAGIG